MYAVLHKRNIDLDLQRLLSFTNNMDPSFAFESSDGHTKLYGFGAMATLRPQNSTTVVTEVQLWFDQLKAQLPLATHADLGIMGAFPFENQPTSQTNIWASWTNGYFFLPKFLLHQQPDSRFQLDVIDTTDTAAALAADQFLTAVHQQPPLTAKPYQQTSAAELDVAHWQAQVDQCVAKIKSDPALKKVVLGRQMMTASKRDFLPGQALLNLKQQNPETYHILLADGGSQFISATPERLVACRDGHLQTAAIAGTCPRGQTEKEDRRLGEALLQDAKNREEQQFVTTEIRQTLEALQIQPNYSPQPTLLKNKNVQHLFTPITGTLPNDLSLLQVVAALHPTPALGGLPKSTARSLIAQSEPRRRGLFGAPIGYMDFHQNGEFAVGIRSAYLNRNKATLFAGAGIVMDSVATQEVAETRLKFQPMLDTLFGGNKSND